MGPRGAVLWAAPGDGRRCAAPWGRLFAFVFGCFLVGLHKELVFGENFHLDSLKAPGEWEETPGVKNESGACGCCLMFLWGRSVGWLACGGRFRCFGVVEIRPFAASNVGEGDDEAYGRSLAGREGVRV